MLICCSPRRDAARPSSPGRYSRRDRPPVLLPSDVKVHQLRSRLIARLARRTAPMRQVRFGSGQGRSVAPLSISSSPSSRKRVSASHWPRLVEQVFSIPRQSSGPWNGVALRNNGWAFIEKPFVPKKLVEMINAVLQKPDKSQGSHQFDTRKDKDRAE